MYEQSLRRMCVLGGFGRLAGARVGACGAWGTLGNWLAGLEQAQCGQPRVCGCGDALKVCLSGAGVGLGWGGQWLTEAAFQVSLSTWAELYPELCRWRGNISNGAYWHL